VKASCLVCCPGKLNSAQPDAFCTSCPQPTSLELCALAAPVAGVGRDWRWGVLGSNPSAPSAILYCHLRPGNGFPQGQALAPGGLDCLGSGRLEEGTLRSEFST